WKHLGETFDIHGGGIDLVFPHHENEIAQSRCAFHTPVMAQYWMHNGFLQVEGEKMSKSLGNFFTIREVLAEWPGEAIRLAMLQTHYRQPINWTSAGLSEAKRTLDHWYQLAGDAGPGMLCADVVEALADDLNTPKAFAALHELRAEAAKGSPGAIACLKASAQMMGLMQRTATEWAAWRPASLTIDETNVASLIEARHAARKARNFKEADRIRDEIAALGVELEDRKDGTTTWRVKRLSVPTPLSRVTGSTTSYSRSRSSWPPPRSPSSTMSTGCPMVRESERELSRERLYLFDTTLRDGAQTNGVDFTLADKLAVASMLDDLGIDYVEGGYPGANPTDTELFGEDRGFGTTFTAFGMTRRPGRSASND